MNTKLISNNQLYLVNLESTQEDELTYCFSYINNQIQNSFTDQDLTNETWKFIKDLPIEYKSVLSENSRWLKLYDVENYCISTLGRIAKFENNKLILRRCMEDKKDGYKTFSLFHQPYQIHRLVLFLFVYNDNILEKDVCDHINFIRIDNRVQNLRWLSHTENDARKSVTNKGKSVIYKVNQEKITCINLNTNEEYHFPNIKEAANFLDIKEIKVSECYKGVLEYIEKDGIKYTFKSTSIFTKLWYPIVQLDNDNNIVNVFLTFSKLKEIYPDISTSNVRNCCDKNKATNKYTYTCEGYRWVYLDYYNTKLKEYLWCKPVELSYQFVQLSPGFKVVKVYTNLFDVIEDGFSLDKVFEMCNEKKRTCKRFTYNGNILKRNWWFLEDYLKEMNLTSIDQLTEQYYTQIPYSIKNDPVQVKEEDHNNEVISTNFELIFDDEENYGYDIEFTKEELKFEEWRPLSSIDQKYKPFMSTIWLNLYDKVNNYYISNLGRVAINKNGKLILKHVQVGKDNYKIIWLLNNSYPVHRLVAFMFIDNPSPDINWCINHKDENRINNRVSNLEWCNIAYNNKYKGMSKINTEGDNESC